MKTQNLFLLLACILLASAHVHSQLIKGVGIKGGVTISNIRMTEYGGSYDNVVNPCVSLFARFLDTEHFALQTDLFYLRKGASVTFKVPENPWDVERTLDYTTEMGFQYLSLALAAQPRVSFESVALYAHLGPTANYMLTVHDFGSLDAFKRFQLGYTVGLGVDFARLFTSHLFIEVQYTGDFQSFYEGFYYHRS